MNMSVETWPRCVACGTPTPCRCGACGVALCQTESCGYNHAVLRHGAADAMTRHIQATHAAPTVDIPLAPVRPTSPLGQHPAFERPCDAPGCVQPTGQFVATPKGSIIHYCDGHEAWALSLARSQRVSE